MPELGVIMTMPRILTSSTRFARKHSGFIKESLKEEMILHWRRRIPDHFKQSARSKYRYEKRGSRYKRRKAQRFGSRRDLVKTRGTEQKFTAFYDRIRAGGSVGKGQITVTLVLKWPFPTGKNAAPGVRVTVMDMAREIEATTVSEQQQIFNGFRDRYLRKFNAGLSDRVRRNVKVAF